MERDGVRGRTAPANLATVTTRGNISSWAKIRRGNYVFLTWKGDHSPRHVHVYKDEKLVVTWDLDNWQPMKGKASRRVLSLIRELEDEGAL